MFELINLIFESGVDDTIDETGAASESDEDNPDLDIFQSSRKPKKNALTLNELISTQDKSLKYLSEAFNCHPDLMHFILLEFHYNQNEVLHKFSESRDTLFKIYSISDQSLPLQIHKSTKELECPICFGSSTNNISLNCGHFFCATCVKDHLEVNYRHPVIYCPSFPNCKCPFTSSNISEFIDTEKAKIHEQELFEYRITVNPGLMRCKNPDCDKILQKDGIRYFSVVECECGTRICWRCKREGHAPLSCTDLEKWYEITDFNSLSDEWLKKFTKPCPKCSVPVQKNDGCNHVNCSRCGCHFCYICGKPFKDGNFYHPDCHKEVTKEMQNILNGHNQTLKIEKYDDLFKQQLKSEMNEKNLGKEHSDTMIQNFIRDGLSLEEAKDLSYDMFRTLRTARSVLKFSFVHTFFLDPNSSDYATFQHHQSLMITHLEKFTYLLKYKNRSPSWQFYGEYVELYEHLMSLLLHKDPYISKVFDQKSNVILQDPLEGKPIRYKQ